MNIWYLSAYDQPNGQSPRTYEFARALAHRGHSVTVFTNSYCHFTHSERLPPGERWRSEVIEGVRVVWLRTIHYKGNGFGRAANMFSNSVRAHQAAAANGGRPDVVIGPSVPLITGWTAKHLAERYNAAFVFEVRDVWPEALVVIGQISRHGLAYWVLRILEKHLYRTADGISAVLAYTWRHVEQSGTSPEKVVWIPNGIRVTEMLADSEYDGGHAPFVAMYVGGFSAAHDVRTIIRAAKILEQRGAAIRFLIVGGGVEREERVAEVRSLGVNSIEFRDRVPKREIPELLGSADILIASFKRTPVFKFGINSNKIYDYLAAGRPILFSGDAPNDPVTASGAGVVTSPQDAAAMAGALEHLMSLEGRERAAMGARGRRYVEAEFNLDNLAERMETLLVESIRARNQHDTRNTQTQRD